MTAAQDPELAGRLRTLRERLRAAGADALLVTNPPNVRYLSAFSAPEDGAVLLTQDAVTLYTDARYTTQAGQEVAIQIEVVPSIDEAVADKLAGRRLAVEGEHMTLGRNRAIARRLGSEPVAVDGFFTALRTVKSEREVAALREAARVTDEAFSAALAMMGPGVREIEVALCLESAMRLAGAEGSAFDIIVASGTRGAMPHGVASQKELAAGELVTLDFGAVVNGYHADMTRTVAVGAVGAEERRLFEAVLEAQEASLAALAPGRTGREIDAVARAALARHGLEEYFTHSLGHGTGLVIHEEPRLSKKSDTVLQPGMIVTVEPGVYLPGFTGLRIEDLAVITSDGHEVLSRSPKGFRSV
ncbi:MAG: Xaa-Pro peptidase family protein [Trueperaceae bacterium]|nr:Xaa-Pro peptidase family protein [Trueperaceae bacterium]